MHNAFMVACALIASAAVLQDVTSPKWQWNAVRRGVYLFAGVGIPLFYYRIWGGAENFTSSRFWGLVILYVVIVVIMLLLSRMLNFIGSKLESRLSRMIQ